MSDPNSTALPPFNPRSSFQFTQPPNPSWSIGDKTGADVLGYEWLEGEKKGWTVIDTETYDRKKIYPLMISGIIPRPIAFVSSISEADVNNLAPFRNVSHNPPTVMFSCTDTPTRSRDTALNIKVTKEFTVNIISEPFVRAANFTAVEAPEGQSEWRGSGLTMAPSVSIKPPRVKESAFSMECELSHVVELSLPNSKVVTQTVIFGLVKKIHIRNDVMTEKGTVDAALLRPVSRLGDISYARLGEGFRLRRDTWQDVADSVLNLEGE